MNIRATHNVIKPVANQHNFEDEAILTPYISVRSAEAAAQERLLNERKLCVALVPELRGKVGGRYSLAELVACAETADEKFDRHSPFHKGEIIEQFERDQEIDFSYGGWMEGRENVFRGTYMDQDQRYVHLGVDINVRSGAKVWFPGAAKVLAVTTFPGGEVGWGTRIDLKHPTLPIVFLIGHLASRVTVRSGQSLGPTGGEVGSVGAISENGYVDPHIHIQAMELSRYHHLSKVDDLDGYGRDIERSLLVESYPEPLEVLRYFLPENP